MILPVVYSVDKILESLIKQITIDGLVGLVQDPLSSLAACYKIVFGVSILSLLGQVLVGR